jgi:hypothetical protein
MAARMNVIITPGFKFRINTENGGQGGNPEQIIYEGLVYRPTGEEDSSRGPLPGYSDPDPLPGYSETDPFPERDDDDEPRVLSGKTLSRSKLQKRKYLICSFNRSRSRSI